MTEHEKMQREKMCVDKLTDGVDPLTDAEQTTERLTMFVSAGVITFRKKVTSKSAQSMSIPTSLTASML